MSGHEFLKQKRVEKGLSLRAMAELTGISFAQVRNIEEGINVPSIEATINMLNALGVPMKQYLEAIGYAEPKRQRSGMAAQGFEPRAA